MSEGYVDVSDLVGWQLTETAREEFESLTRVPWVRIRLLRIRMLWRSLVLVRARESL